LSADIKTYVVTFHYLGCDWFLCGKSWTVEPARASHYINAEAAGAALATARRFMKNKQVKARIVAAAPTVGTPPVGSDKEQEERMALELRGIPGRDESRPSAMPRHRSLDRF